MKYWFRVFLASFLYLFVLKGDEKEDFINALSSDERFQAEVIAGNNQLGFDFFRVAEKQVGNFCFSPFSIATGLGILGAGAKGETADQLRKALRYSLNLAPVNGDLDLLFTPSIGMGNGLWLQKEIPITPFFKLTIEKQIRGAVQQVDFMKSLATSLQTINQWVSKKTNDKIQNILTFSELTPETQCVLTTALVVRSSWQWPFEIRNTKRVPFFLSAQRTTTADLMSNTSNYPLMKGEELDLIVLPLQNEFALSILLPKNRSLEELEKKLTYENWKAWTAQLKTEKVAVSLPRFKFDKRFDLNTTLDSLNLAQLFTPAADFSIISESKKIFVDRAVHKTTIKVDEKGVETIQSVRSSEKPMENSPEEAYAFTANHPFIFVIWHQKTGTILLMGRVSIP